MLIRISVICSVVIGMIGFADAGGLTPAEAVQQMQLPAGFSVRCVASEPMIRQPISMSFDEQGRMWVMQYIQYPVPAGLKPVKQDQYLRTIWDKIPEPPPHGPKGADKLTILFDPDEHGVFRQSKDFLTGLNLASGFCRGNGGVYVLQSPYLLFYADRDGDDLPDADPEVLLTGFGFDDTHSVANSLQWGPDGWLYGAAGSTSTSKIPNPAQPEERIEFQQGIWRYHPKTKQFELFSEGGGNTFGLDFDKTGQCIAGTNWGGFAMLHQLQGAYYVKGFSKHGPLHNPHTYGYLDHVPYKSFQGGHVTCGGVIYEADVYPQEYRGQYIAANLLSNCINWHKITPQGATFTNEHGGSLLKTPDITFRPIDCLLGPDGCIYVVDWTDKRAAHLDPIDNWDKTNGRIYRIEYHGGPKYPSYDLRKSSDQQLVQLLTHTNMWWRKEAQRLLGERHLDPKLITNLKARLATDEGQGSLEALWVLHGQSAITPEDAAQYVRHPNENVRAWTYRLLGDNGVLGAAVLQALKHRTFPRAGATFEPETSARVHAQLFCTAKRLSFAEAWPVIEMTQRLTGLHKEVYTSRTASEAANLESKRPKDALFEHLEWWAAEPFVRDHHAQMLPSVRGVMNNKEVSLDGFDRKMIRRALAEDVPDGLVTIQQMLHPDRRLPSIVLEELLTAVRSGRFKSIPAELRVALDETDQRPITQEIRARLGEPNSLNQYREALTVGSGTTRLQAVNLLSDLRDPASLEVLFEFLPSVPQGLTVPQVLSALGKYEDPKVALALIPLAQKAPGEERKRLFQTLLSRPAWAMSLFQAYDAGKFAKTDLTLDQAKQAVVHEDKALTTLVEKHFGKIAPATAGEKRARIAALNMMLSRGPAGDPVKGKEVFIQQCIECHQFHGEGGKLGPDLTTADRKNRGYMLASIVDPSGYIRTEYVNHRINTIDGRTLTGIVLRSDDQSLTLGNFVDRKAVQAVILKGDIDTLEPLNVSLMPEQLLDSLSNDEVRHLFAYLASDPKPAPRVRQAGEKTFRIALISGSLEYKSDETLPVLQEYLEANYPVECVRLFRKTDDNIPGLEKLMDFDLAIFYTRRLTVDGEQLQSVKKYVESGKPILGIRTASHGFQKWLEMDTLAFGGNYKGHYSSGPKCELSFPESAKAHPILEGVKPFVSVGSLYKNQGHAGDITVLMKGTIPGQSEPVTWIRERKLPSGKVQRVFYTSLGHPKDFEEESFLKLLGNAVAWSMKK